MLLIVFAAWQAITDGAGAALKRVATGLRMGRAAMTSCSSPGLLVLAATLALALAACSNPEKKPAVGVGTVGGGAAGAVAGGLVASNPAGLAVGAVAGGTVGYIGVDRPRGKSKREQAESARIAEQNRGEARQRAYENNLAEHEDAIRREAREARLLEGWRRERTTLSGGFDGGGGTADVMEAQRLLAAQGHYQGPIDGVYGKETEAAVKSFETARGLPATGALTPALMSQMRATL